MEGNVVKEVVAMITVFSFTYSFTGSPILKDTIMPEKLIVAIKRLTSLLPCKNPQRISESSKVSN